METPLVVGVIEGEVPTGSGLAQAAARHPGLSLKSLAVDGAWSDTPPTTRSTGVPAPGTAGLALDQPSAAQLRNAARPARVSSDILAGVIIDAPLGQRAQFLARAAARWSAPMLIEAPLASDLEGARVVEGLAANSEIVVANPLRYALHTRRLLEEVARTQDALETFFAAWRFRGQASAQHALPQLLDFLRALGPGPDQLCRISAMEHAQPAVLTATLRYASDVFGSIEVGSHLPSSFPAESELVVECFCGESAYSCVPGNQAVQFYGRGHGAVDWAPEPADAIVAAFAGWLGGGARPPGGIAGDLETLRLVDRVRQALRMGGVHEVKQLGELAKE